MLEWEHSAILLTFNKLTVVIKTFVLSFFEWPFNAGFTVTYLDVIFFLHFIKNLKPSDMALIFSNLIRIW